MQLTDDKKLTVIFRIEPGCLGPQGAEHIEAFCKQAYGALSGLHKESFLLWQVVPRHDKTLPEVDYSLQGRPLSRDHASRYLQLFSQEIDEFEMKVFDELPTLIDQYFGR